MIDWVTVELPFLHSPIDSGYFLMVKPGGDIDWKTPRRQSIEGSFRSTMQVRSIGGNGAGQATLLQLSGNPSKFLQGHNVFGSNDLVALVNDTAHRVFQSLGIWPTDLELRAIAQGDYRLINVDITESFELPTRGDVIAWIRALEFKAKSRHGRPSIKGGTLYFGKGTSRWKLKAYCKGEELESKKKGHQLPVDLLNTPIKQWADNKLRIELTLLSKELREIGIEVARTLTPELCNQLYRRYTGRIEMNEQISLTSQQQHELPTKLQSTYLHWNNGIDLRSILPKATFYRHRRELLEFSDHLGHRIDIALRKEVSDTSNVVPLIRVLEAVPAGLPEWAHEMGLVHSSAASGRW